MTICNRYGQRISLNCKLLIYAMHNSLLKKYITIGTLKGQLNTYINIGYGFSIVVGDKCIYKGNNIYKFNITDKHIYKLYCIYGDQIMKML